MYKLNTDLVGLVSRYDMAKFVPFTDMYDVLDSQFLKALKSLKDYGIYPVTVEENNPALLAERIYGLYNTQYWWILMVFNDIIDVGDIVSGMTIRYPRIADLERIYFQLTPNSKTLTYTYT